MLPDTQYYSAVTEYHRIFSAQARWLAERADELDLQMVIHVGDVVDASWVDEQS